MADETIACVSVAEKKRIRRRRAYEAWRIKHPKLPPREPINSPNGRLCRTCNERKTPECFKDDKRSVDGLAWRCRDCARRAHGRWRANNVDHVRDEGRGYQRRVYARNPEKARETLRRSRLRVKYGIEFEELLDRIAKQDGGCAICIKPLAVRTFDRRKGNVACVDHDHKTGKIRGILCSHCNRGLGLLGDDPVRLDKAAEYLRASAQ